MNDEKLAVEDFFIRLVDESEGSMGKKMLLAEKILLSNNVNNNLAKNGSDVYIISI